MFHLTTALDAASGVPLYEQLYESLAAEMRSGAIPAGTRMPGKRRLAAELSVSVNTVDAAYQILATEGYMEPRERSGFYVQEYLALPTRPEEVPPPVSAAPPEAAEPPVRFDLSTRGVDPGLFPFRTWARLQKELLYSSPQLLTHGDAQGDVELRQALADYLLQFARHLIYSTSMPPAQAQALRAALAVIRSREGDERREKLAMLIQRFRAGVNTTDLTLAHSDSAIQPLIVGDNHKALQLAQTLRQQGCWVTAIRPPTVPTGTARLRLTLTQAHEVQDIDRLLEVLHGAGQ